MATDLAELQILVNSLSVDKANKRLNTLEKQSAATEKRVGGLNNQFKKTATTAKRVNSSFIDMTRNVLKLAAAYGAMRLAVRAFERAATFEQTEVAFRTLIGNTSTATALLKDLEKFSATTPFRFQGLAEASRRMLALGFEAKEIPDLIRKIGDATAALGGGQLLMNRLVLALGQMQAKARVSGEEMRQLAEAGIPAWEIVADTLGKTIPEAMELSERKAIPFQKTFNAIIESMGTRFAGATANLSQTTKGLFTTLQDNIEFALRDIGDILIQELNIKESLRDVIEFAAGIGAALRANLPSLVLFIEALKGAAIAMAVFAAAKILGFLGKMVLGIRVAIGALAGLRQAMATNPVTALAVAVTSLTAALILYIRATKDASDLSLKYKGSLKAVEAGLNDTFDAQVRYDRALKGDSVDEQNRAAEAARAMATSLESVRDELIKLEAASDSGSLVLADNSELEKTLKALGLGEVIIKDIQKEMKTLVQTTGLGQPKITQEVETTTRSLIQTSDAIEKIGVKIKEMQKAAEGGAKALGDVTFEGDPKADAEAKARLKGLSDLQKFSEGLIFEREQIARTAEEREIATKLRTLENFAIAAGITNITELLAKAEEEIKKNQSLQRAQERVLAARKKNVDQMRKERDAAIAADNTIADIFRTLELEKELIGLTNEERERAITLRKLEAAAADSFQNDSDEVVAAYKEQLAALEKLKDADKIAKDIGSAFGDAFTDVVTGAKTAEEALRSFAQEALRIAVQQTIAKQAADTTRSIVNAVFAGFSATNTTGTGGTTPTVNSANGNAFSQGSIIPFANGGIVRGPTLFPMKNGAGLMGEAGPEAVMPLKRGADGKLGVSGGGTTINQTVNLNVKTQDANSFNRSKSQIMATAASAGQAAGRAL